MEKLILIFKNEAMKVMKYFVFLFLTITLFSCSNDDLPPCVETVWYLDADNDTLGNPNVVLMSCTQPEGYVGNNDDLDDTDPLNLDPLVEAKVTNLHAPQTGGQGQGPIGGEFIKFDFTSGQITTSEADWDIAFRGTTIIVNGGEASGTNDEPVRNGNAAVYIADGNMESITEANGNFVSDASGNLAITTGSGNGWYLYDFTTHLINPISGKILVFRTRDGKYAKVKIESYYNNLDSSDYANARYYTFDYVYQPNEGITTF